MAFKELFQFGGIFDFVHRGRADLDEANRGVASLERNLTDAINKADVFGLSVGQAFAVGAGLIAGGAATFAGLKRLSDSALPLEEQIGRVTTLLDEQGRVALSTEAQVSGLVGLSSKYGRASDELGNALFQVVSAGVAADEALGFLDATLAGAVAGGADVFATVDGVTTVLNAMGLQAEDAGSQVAGAQRILDEFFTANRVGKTTVEELARSLGQVAPIAAAVGVESGEVLGAIAALTSQGQKTSVATTNLAQALQNVIKPTKEAQTLAAQLGIEFDAAALGAKGLAGFLLDVEAAANGDTQKLSTLFGSVEALKAVLALTSDTGAAKFLDSLDAMDASAGAVAMGLADVEATATFQTQRLNNALDGLAETLGFRLLPLRSRITGFFADAVEGMVEFVDAHPGLIRAAGVLAAGLGALASVGGVIITGFAIKAAVALPAVSAALYSVGLAVGSTLAVMLPFLPAILAVGAAAAYVATEWDSLSAGFDSTAGPAISRLSETWAAFTSGLALEDHSTEWAYFATVLEDVAYWLGEIAGYTVGAAADGLTFLIEAVGEGIEQIGRETDAIGGFFSGLGDQFGIGSSVTPGAPLTPAPVAVAGGGAAPAAPAGAGVVEVVVPLQIDGREVGRAVARAGLNDAERRGEVPTGQANGAVDGVLR